MSVIILAENTETIVVFSPKNCYITSAVDRTEDNFVWKAMDIKDLALKSNLGNPDTYYDQIPLFIYSQEWYIIKITPK